VKLDGRDLQLIPGAIMVYLHFPLHHAARDAESLTEDERVLLALVRRMRESSSDAYPQPGSLGNMAWRDTVRRQLAATLEWEFTEQERQSLGKALRACVIELEKDSEADINIHFCGDDYGIRREHFEQLRRRINEEL
jgi:hypothetical protein